ncbi:hypothetical protein PPACK8108_LOCUS20505 [Phakopsora pachyrhizi]|uniref:Uncharacterized protein n=1 Tax=Phakopsora pachyrhizi TaxID=170000 RepID=A0AAV0BK64_PHAPC|nr:hypothetical protein PPACK8108_LOCUS20505 [Phakopsora pachyrhizi]
MLELNLKTIALLTGTKVLQDGLEADMMDAACWWELGRMMELWTLENEDENLEQSETVLEKKTSSQKTPMTPKETSEPDTSYLWRPMEQNRYLAMNDELVQKENKANELNSLRKQMSTNYLLWRKSWSSFRDLTGMHPTEDGLEADMMDAACWWELGRMMELWTLENEDENLEQSETVLEKKTSSQKTPMTPKETSEPDTCKRKINK